MFSGCRPQASRALKGVVRSDSGVKIYHSVSFLRHLWSAHINDRKRNQNFQGRTRYYQLHTQPNSADLLEDSDSRDQSAADLTVPNPKGSRDSEHYQHFNTIHPETRGISFESIGEPITGISIGEALEPESHGQLNQLLDDKTSGEQRKGAAHDIDLHRKWKEKWQRRRTAKQLIKNLRLKKGPLAHDWREPLKIVWKRHAPVSGLRQRGRLFRVVSSGTPPGIHTSRIEEPVTWSKVIFDQYVYQLTRVQPPPSPVARALNAGSRQQVESRSTRERGEVLHRLMHRRMLHAFIEPEICNVAIHFLTRHAMIAKARSILLLMEHLRLHIEPSTFNIFLRAAVHQQDLATFMRLLQIMKVRGIRRDSGTLVLLIQCLRSRKDKAEIIRTMEIMGTRLKNRLMMRAVLTATVKQDIAGFLESGGNPTDFLRQLRRKYKFGWLNTRIGNIILDQVCKRVSLAAGLDLLPALEREGFLPDIITLNTPLFLALSYRSLPLAADVLDRFARDYNIHPDHTAYQRLFQLAWHRRWLNVSALTWLAACLHGAVTTEMQNTVLYSIRLNNSIQHTAQRTASFSSSSSARIDTSIDNSPAAPLPASPSTPLPGKSARVFAVLMGNFVLGLNPFEHQGQAHVRGTIAKMIRNLATTRLKLKYSLGCCLRAAHERDREWRIHEGKDVREKLVDPCPVLLEWQRDPRTERTRKGERAKVSFVLYWR